MPASSSSSFLIFWAAISSGLGSGRVGPKKIGGVGSLLAFREALLDEEGVGLEDLEDGLLLLLLFLLLEVEVGPGESRLSLEVALALGDLALEGSVLALLILGLAAAPAVASSGFSHLTSLVLVFQ